MAEVRTTSATGGEKGVKPQRHDLLPRQALDAIAEVYAFGAGKYADHNWRKGYEWGKSYAALQRHLTAWWDGESVDPESGLSHLGHAGFHVFALLTWLSKQGEGVDNVMDDRWPHGLERARLAVEEDEEAINEPLHGWLVNQGGAFSDETSFFELHSIPVESLRLMLGLVPTGHIEAHFVTDGSGVTTDVTSYGPDLLSKRPAAHRASPPYDGDYIQRAFDRRGR